MVDWPTRFSNPLNRSRAFSSQRFRRSARCLFAHCCWGTSAMSEKSRALRATLDELHEQLASVETRDPEVRALLARALDDLRAALDATAGHQAGRPEEGLTERFEEAAAYFEEEHPMLAGTVRRLIDMLSQMGI